MSSRRRDLEHLLGDDPLQPRVLGLELPQLLRIRDLHPAERLAPRIERRRRDPVTSAQVLDLGPRLVLLQNRDHLLVAEPASLHPSSSFIV
jgi:hypothetical protein